MHTFVPLLTGVLKLDQRNRPEQLTCTAIPARYQTGERQRERGGRQSETGNGDKESGSEERERERSGVENERAVR